MRQVAITVVLAQIGCFVPADEATLPLFDKIFTRIGAADDLVSGQSTFMVEMLETEHALREATADSLLLLDEIGRGTSTYDGMAPARSIVEYIHDYIGAKTLFSTHYHELTVLEDDLETLWNIHVRAEEEAGEVIFLHKVEEGRADKSYGIHVAQLAHLPDRVIERARALLDEYENERLPQNASDLHEQVPLFTYEEEKKPIRSGNKKDETTEAEKVSEQIRDMDVLNITPLEAMTAINQWKKQLRSKK